MRTWSENRTWSDGQIMPKIEKMELAGEYPANAEKLVEKIIIERNLTPLQKRWNKLIDFLIRKLTSIKA